MGPAFFVSTQRRGDHRGAQRFYYSLLPTHYFPIKPTPYLPSKREDYVH